MIHHDATPRRSPQPSDRECPGEGCDCCPVEHVTPDPDRLCSGGLPPRERNPGW